MSRTEINGNEITSKDGENFFYSSDNKTVDWYNIRKCPACGKKQTKEGHDACLGTLRGVRFACCGHHSSKGHPYVVFNNGLSINFDSIKSLYEYFNIRP